MADKPISELNPSGTLSGTEVVPVVQGGVTVKTTINAIKAFVASISGGAWGSITGSLASQTDLKGALDAKQNQLVAGTNITINNTNPLAPIISSTGGGGVIEDVIVDGVTTKAPSQNAVFDALALKEPVIATSTGTKYFAENKTFKDLNKAAVLLGNVDNTSDPNKPVSIATQTALNTKQNSLVAGANIIIDNTNPLAPVISSTGGGGGSGGTLTAVSVATANGLSGTSSGGTTPVLTLQMQNATTSQDGKLIAADWAKFNNKQNQLTAGTNITIDVTNPLAPVINAAGLTKNTSAEIITGTDDAKYTTALGLSGSNYQRSATLAAGFLPYSVDGKVQANSPFKRIDGTKVELNGRVQSPSGNAYINIVDSGINSACINGANISYLISNGTAAQAYATDGTNASSVTVYPNEIQLDSNQITHAKGLANTILSLNASKKVTYNSGVGFLKMDAGGNITFEAIATGVTETNTIYSAAWSTQTLANVRALYYYVNASDSTAKTINLFPTPTIGDLVVIKDKKGDATTNNITIQGNTKLIDGVASILINTNNQSYILKYDGVGWNIM